MSHELQAHPSSTWIAAAILLAFAAVIWLPAVVTPFWGDDYSFLQGAHAANSAGDSWWSVFWPERMFGFWRPLSQESWWRFVDGTLGADPQRTHWANLVLLMLAAACVGLLALAIARSCAWSQPAATAVLGGAIYGVLALHFLPVHWAAAANSSMLVAFTALLLAAWVAAPRARPFTRGLLLISIPLSLVAALLSKESAAMIPMLMIVLSLFVGKGAPRRLEAAVWVACAVLVVAWLMVRARISAGADPHYDLLLGTNLLRNGLSLVAWLLNVPRETLRLVLTGAPWLGILWSAAVALPMIAVWIFAARRGLRQFGRRQSSSCSRILPSGICAVFSSGLEQLRLLRSDCGHPACNSPGAWPCRPSSCGRGGCADWHVVLACSCGFPRAR